jgi:hypothetical protein
MTKLIINGSAIETPLYIQPQPAITQTINDNTVRTVASASSQLVPEIYGKPSDKLINALEASAMDKEWLNIEQMHYNLHSAIIYRVFGNIDWDDYDGSIWNYDIATPDKLKLKLGIEYRLITLIETGLMESFSQLLGLVEY